MQALKIDRHGPVSELSVSDVPVPTIESGEVLIEIEAASVNPSDIVSAEGRFPNSRLPRVLGRDFAGHVVQGPPELIGKKVWGSGGDLGITRDGTHAEFVAIPLEAVSVRPVILTSDEAAAVGLPFQTAWLALVEKGGLRANESVIVSGAAGAVGSAAVQIANALGARAIALVKDANEAARIDPPLKVDAVAHSDADDLAAVVNAATGGAKSNLAINAVGGAIFQPLLEALANDGRMVVLSAVGGREVTLDLLALYRANLSVRGLNTVLMDVVGGAKILDRLAPWFEQGTLRPPRVAERYPLSKAADAYRALSRGKIVLIPDRLHAA